MHSSTKTPCSTSAIGLAELIRQKQDENALLQSRIADLDDECSFHRLSAAHHPPSNEESVTVVDLRSDLSTAILQQSVDNSLVDAYRLLSQESVLTCALGVAELKHEQRVSVDLRQQLRETRESLYAAQDARSQTESHLTSRVAELEEDARLLIERAEIFSLGDKRTIKQLTESVRMARLTEEGLRNEITSMTAAIAESEQFQQAYYSLSDEVQSLIARKELAEGEADKLSKFNAEILGHHNPAQKIMYVDRVRRELADAKHKLALAAVDLQNAKSENAALARELELYTAVDSEKPRTVVTRVARAPLATLNRATPSPSHTATPVGCEVSPPVAKGWQLPEHSEDFSYTI
uniref:Uncharacterized protein n=1 Tax=Mycena chlorophos TaxID=658473 RepID=A0ABQ0M2U0_MYCCL|nr:predicted protein [Mycena chlorophos]